MILRFQNAMIAMVVLAICASGVISQAATKSQRAKESDELVKEALSREVYGQERDRKNLLKEAISKTPSHAAAHWHLGHVNENGKWVDFRDHAEHCQKLPRLAEYRRIRNETTNDVQGNLKLATWCAKNKLADQERAHLTRVIELVPDHPDARRRLGHLMVDGEWLSVEDRRDIAADDKSARESLAKWRPTLNEITRWMIGETFWLTASRRYYKADLL